MAVSECPIDAALHYTSTWNYTAFQPDGTAPASTAYETDNVRITRKEESTSHRVFEIETNSASLVQPCFGTLSRGGKPHSKWRSWEGMPPLEWCPPPLGSRGSASDRGLGSCIIKVTGQPSDQLISQKS